MAKHVFIFSSASGVGKTTTIYPYLTKMGGELMETGLVFKALCIGLPLEPFYVAPDLNEVYHDEAALVHAYKSGILVRGLESYERHKGTHINGYHTIMVVEGAMRSVRPDAPSQHVAILAKHSDAEFIVTDAINLQEMVYLVDSLRGEYVTHIIRLECTDPVKRVGDNRSLISHSEAVAMGCASVISYQYALEDCSNLAIEIGTHVRKCLQMFN